MKYEREFTNEELACLHHYVTDAKEWIDAAINGKIAACQKRIIQKQFNEALDKGAVISSQPAEVLSAVFSKADYKNRKQRDDGEKPTKEEQPPKEEPIETPKEEKPEDDNGEPVKTPV